MIHKLPTGRGFWAAFSLLGIAISTAAFLATGNPGTAGLVASSIGVVLSLCKLQQEKSATSPQSSNASISSRDQM
jgi:hypothetical protein